MARPQITDVKVTESDLAVELSDGRNLSVSLGLFPQLSAANKEERNNWHLIAGGIGVYWPELEEDIALRTLLELSGSDLRDW